MSKAVKIGAALLVLTVIGTGFSMVGKPERQSSGTTETVTPIVVSEDKALTSTKQSVLHVDANSSQIILLNTEVSEESVNEVISELQKAKENNDRVYLVISSPGGSVISGVKLVSYIENSKIEINTVCSEVCASMAFHIFEAGKNRYMENRSILMGHPASGGARGTLPEMLSMLNAVKLLTDRLDAKIAKRANIPYEKFEVMVLRNLWIEAVDAVKMGLADKIIALNYDKMGTNVFDTADVLRRKGIKIKTNATELSTLNEIR